ncbi:hypothetical protein E2562_030179 [Oryza meyeriana var. granulata]|uniref:CCHC-type domain-containing protein n=1 Tax=Oryza meyeriana var. granulata TaxID=110450 RepID=A0A6G1BPK2_9ORYZ|nr:hypothetical protein E2562_030179 [Oryza meyeriana var. granulata]
MALRQSRIRDPPSNCKAAGLADDPAQNPRKEGALGGSGRGKKGDGKQDTASDKCYYCGRLGHWAKDYRQPKKETAHLAQGDDDDDVLLLARASRHEDDDVALLMAQTTGYPMPGSGGDAIPPSATSTSAQENAAPPSPATPTPAKRAATTEFVSPPSHDEKRLDTAHSDTPVRYCTVDNLIGEDVFAPHWTW